MSERQRVAKAYEAALFAGRMEEVGRYMADDVVYWVAGPPPLGGEWRGRDAVLQAFERREFGLGAGDWGYEDLERSGTRRRTGSSWRFASGAGSKARRPTSSTSAPAW